MHIPNVPITRRVVYRSGAIRCSLSRVNEARFGLGALALRGLIASIPIQGPFASITVVVAAAAHTRFPIADCISDTECLLYPRKRSLVERIGMSALCQKATVKSPRAPKVNVETLPTVLAQAACSRFSTRISWITSNTRTPSSLGIGASHGEACKVLCASARPCCHRASIAERLNSKSFSAPCGSIGR
jgi:hypothetical protein